MTVFGSVPSDLVEALQTVTRTFSGVEIHGPGKAHGTAPPTRVASTSPGLAALLAEHYTFAEGARNGPDGQPLPANQCSVVEPSELLAEYAARHSAVGEQVVEQPQAAAQTIDPASAVETLPGGGGS